MNDLRKELQNLEEAPDARVVMTQVVNDLEKWLRENKYSVPSIYVAEMQCVLNSDVAGTINGLELEKEIIDIEKESKLENSSEKNKKLHN